jgi:hypothetical protein
VAGPAAGVAMNYLIVNSCSSDVAGTVRTMGQQSDTMTLKGVVSIVGGVAEEVGSIISDVTMPMSGPLVQLIWNSLQSVLGQFFSANCDGPVAAEQPMFTGQQLWANTLNGPYNATTKHLGIDSNWGCGSNSVYTVSWSITRS